MLNRDKQFIWHPYTQHGLEPELLPVVSAQSALLTLENNQKILDAISSWWVNIHGHSHPHIINAVYEQIQKLQQVIFAGCTHEPAIQLAELLINAVRNCGTDLQYCFYSDNGSTAVEAAMKIAFKYHQNKGQHSRKKFISLKNSYHGETLGCVAVSEREGFNNTFSELLFEVDFIPIDNIETLKNLVANQAEQYAAIIVEPLIQAVTGGMNIYNADYLTQIYQICLQHNILIICDEIFTGFYRTGTCFAFEQAQIKPDLLCLGKSLTGGFLPLAVTLATTEIYNAFYANNVNQAFIHGHSYTANPIACVAAIASWQILQHPNTQAAIKRISQYTKYRINKLSQHPLVTKPRSLGTIGAFNIGNQSNYFSHLSYVVRKLALQKNVLLRPLGNVIYTLPPYCVTDDEMVQIYDAIEYILNYLENNK